MPRLRTAGWTLLAASAAALALSGAVMTARITDYYQEHPTTHFHFVKAADRQTTFRGRPVSLTDALTESGRPAIRLRYGDREALFEVHPPPVRDLKDLGGYEEWMKPVLVAPIKEGHIAADPNGDDVRFVVVNRRTAPDFDPDTWGAVQVKQFQFDFYELQPDGLIGHRVMQFPARDYRTGKYYLPEAKKDPNTEVQMLQERTWEWQAALFAMPAMQISRYRYSTTAVNAMGWTLPVAGFSVLGMLGGVGLLTAARIDDGRRARAAAVSAASAAQ